MPDFYPTPVPVESNSYYVNVIGVGGDTSGTGIDWLDTVTGAELLAFRAAVGGISNAAIFKTTTGFHVEISKGRAVPLDEAHSSVKMKMKLVFENDELDVKEIGIPAPDASYFTGDGRTVVSPNAAAAAGTPAKLMSTYIQAIALVLNGGAAADPVGTYRYVRGYRSGDGRPAPGYDPTTAAEPISTTEPGPESNPEGTEGA
jgi:hypothetical protein